MYYAHEGSAGSTVSLSLSLLLALPVSPSLSLSLYVRLSLPSLSCSSSALEGLAASLSLCLSYRLGVVLICLSLCWSSLAVGWKGVVMSEYVPRVSWRECLSVVSSCSAFLHALLVLLLLCYVFLVLLCIVCQSVGLFVSLSSSRQLGFLRSSMCLVLYGDCASGCCVLVFLPCCLASPVLNGVHVSRIVWGGCLSVVSSSLSVSCLPLLTVSYIVFLFVLVHLLCICFFFFLSYACRSLALLVPPHLVPLLVIFTSLTVHSPLASVFLSYASLFLVPLPCSLSSFSASSYASSYCYSYSYARRHRRSHRHSLSRIRWGLCFFFSSRLAVSCSSFVLVLVSR